MTFSDLWGSIDIKGAARALPLLKIYQNHFINEWVRKILAKISESLCPVDPRTFRFLVRCRRT